MMLTLLDINNFGPLSADVWGTVSDWSMVLVTLLSVILLFITFNSQRKVQQNQAELTAIEQFKHRKALLPELSFEGQTFEDQVIDEDGNFHVQIKFTFLVIQNALLDMFTICDPGEEWSLTLKPGRQGTFKEGSGFSFYGTLTQPKNQFGIHVGSFALIVKFQDEYNTKYEQTFAYHYWDGRHSTSYGRPIILV